MRIGFDLISDLNLSPDDSFNWENKATSLYCIVAGNISPDVRTIFLTLQHLSKFYQGVFYVFGSTDYNGTDDINHRTEQLLKVCSRIPNLAVLHHNVVIINGIALLGVNGWYGNTLPSDEETNRQVEICRYEDLFYLKESIEKLQKHLDVKKIVLVSNSVPNAELYFGEMPDFVKEQIPVDIALASDTEEKVSHWLFGTHKKIVDTTINNINYINNPCYNQNPYWAKRVEIEV